MSFEQSGLSQQEPLAVPAEAAEVSIAMRSRRLPRAKEQVTLQLDVDIVSMFRATGRGWQARMNTALREWLGPPWTT